MTKSTDIKQHYYLITGEIIFRHKEVEDSIQGIRINGVLVNDKADIPVRQIGRAQQTLQLNFHQKMQDENIEVLDVVIYGFSHLGYMTHDEFHEPPAGTKLQERKPAAAEPVPDLDEIIAEAKKKGH